MVKKKRVRVRDLYGPFAGFRQGSAIVAQDVVVVDCVETIVRSEGCIAVVVKVIVTAVSTMNPVFCAGCADTLPMIVVTTQICFGTEVQNAMSAAEDSKAEVITVQYLLSASRSGYYDRKNVAVFSEPFFFET